VRQQRATGRPSPSSDLGALRLSSLDRKGQTKMTRQRDDDERFRDAFDKHGILKDGKAVRYRTAMMDSASVPKRDTVTDASGGTSGLHRPGYRLPAAPDPSAAERRRDAYLLYDIEQKYAYRRHSPLVTDDDTDDELEDSPVLTVDEAYALYERDLVNAWRKR
jgi:hypothetical protein